MWQFILAVVLGIAAVIFAAGIFYSMTTTTLAAHQKEIDSIKGWEATHETDQNATVDYGNKKIDEMSFNMQAICKKLGIEYISTTKQKE